MLLKRKKFNYCLGWSMFSNGVNPNIVQLVF